MTDPKDAACPRCGAEAGQPCKTKTGAVVNSRGNVHPARLPLPSTILTLLNTKLVDVLEFRPAARAGRKDIPWLLRRAADVLESDDRPIEGIELTLEAAPDGTWVLVAQVVHPQ